MDTIRKVYILTRNSYIELVTTNIKTAYLFIVDSLRPQDKQYLLGYEATLNRIHKHSYYSFALPCGIFYDLRKHSVFSQYKKV